MKIQPEELGNVGASANAYRANPKKVFLIFLKTSMHGKCYYEYNFSTQVLKKISICESYSIENEMQVNDNEDILMFLNKENNEF